MSATTIERASLLTGRQMVLLAVIGLHVLAVVSLMSMRIPLDVKAQPGLQLFDPVAPDKPFDPPPELLPPELVPSDTLVVVPPVVPGPVIGVQVLPAVPVDSGITLPPSAEPVASTPGTSVEIPATELQSRAVRSPDDYYPATSIQLQEEGLAVVNVCVGPTGRLEGAPTVRNSSGSRRLDAAAVKWASEALAFTPATRNGAAVSACREYRVRFSLR